MDRNAKQGSIVKYVSGKYHEGSGNPLWGGKEGFILGKLVKSAWGLEVNVDWNNGRSNCYNYADLELASEEEIQAVKKKDLDFLNKNLSEVMKQHRARLEKERQEQEEKERKAKIEREEKEKKDKKELEKKLSEVKSKIYTELDHVDGAVYHDSKIISKGYSFYPIIASYFVNNPSEKAVQTCLSVVGYATTKEKWEQKNGFDFFTDSCFAHHAPSFSSKRVIFFGTYNKIGNKELLLFDNRYTAWLKAMLESDLYGPLVKDRIIIIPKNEHEFVLGFNSTGLSEYQYVLAVFSIRAAFDRADTIDIFNKAIKVAPPTAAILYSIMLRNNMEDRTRDSKTIFVVNSNLRVQGFYNWLSTISLGKEGNQGDVYAFEENLTRRTCGQYMSTYLKEKINEETLREFIEQLGIKGVN